MKKLSTFLVMASLLAVQVQHEARAASIQAHIKTTAPGSITSDLQKLVIDTAPGSKPKPMLIKDSSNRPVLMKMDFLADISGANLATVSAAFANNVNVQKVLALPSSVAFNFDSLSPNVALSSFSGSSQLWTLSVTEGSGEWQGATAAESGGSGSALRLTNTVLGGDALSADVKYDAVSNGIASINASKMKFSVKLSDTVNGVAGATASGYEAQAARVTPHIGGGCIGVTAKNGNWWIIPCFNPNHANPAPVDTGVAQTAKLYVKYEQSLASNTVSWGATSSYGSSMTGFAAYPNSSGSMPAGEAVIYDYVAPSGSPTVLQKALIIDDLDFELIDADILT